MGKLSSSLSACLLSLSCLCSISHAAWDQQPSPGSVFPPAGVDTTRIDVLGEYRSWNNGQYSDIYYPKGSGWSNTMIQSATCVFVHYHGGGWYTEDTRYTPIPGANAQATADNLTILPALVNRFVRDLGCIFIAMSYPLADVNPATGSIFSSAVRGETTPIPITLRTIVGDDRTPYRPGSVFQTFDQFYTTQFLPWKAMNPGLLLYVGGESAGAYLAQRVATNGSWGVNASLVAGVPVFNPRSRAGSNAISELLDDFSVDACSFQHLNPVVCATYRNLYGEHGGGSNPLDLHGYTPQNPTLNTFYIANICDDLAEVGAAMPGWFNGISATQKQLLVHKGFGDTNAGLGTGHGHFGAMYADFFDSSKSGSWLVNSFLNPGATLTPSNGKYGPLCSTTMGPDREMLPKIRN